MHVNSNVHALVLHAKFHKGKPLVMSSGKNLGVLKKNRSINLVFSHMPQCLSFIHKILPAHLGYGHVV
jgi:hypothetical protein